MRGYRQLLRDNRDFRRLWLGDVASFWGDWFNLIAIYTSVQSITASTLAISAVVAAKTLPNFAMIPIAGPLVDRFDRRSLLVFSDVFRALAVLGLIASHHAGSLAGLYSSTLVMTAFTGIAFPAKKAALPMLVRPRHISVANALSGGTWSIMLAVGSAFGGAAVATLGITASFALDGFTFLISAWFFVKLPRLIPPAAKCGDQASFADALRYLRRTPYILALTCIKPLSSGANSVVLTVIPLFGLVTFPGQSGPFYLGILYMLRGAGAAVGSMGLRAMFGDRPRNLRRLIVFGFVLMFAGLTLTAQADVFWLVGVGFFTSAIGSGGNWVLSGTLLQLEADHSFHGRVFSLEFGVTTMVLAVGSLAAGAVQDYAGVSTAGVTQWWALLVLPALAFWVVTLILLRRQRFPAAPSEPPLQPAPPL